MAPTAWQLLRGLAAWQVTQIPRQPQRQPPGGLQDEGDLLAGQRAAALGAAYHGGAGPVGFAWVRDRAGGPVQVLARLPCWIRISGVADSLLAARDPEPARAIRPSLEDGLLAAWPGPFGWLVFAEPVSRAELEELTFRVYAAQGAAQRFDSPQAQLTARRLRDRHAERRELR